MFLFTPAYLFKVVFEKCVCVWRTWVFFRCYGVLSGIIYNYSLSTFFLLFKVIQSHTFAAENCAIGNIVKLKKRDVLCRMNVAMWVLLI